MKKKVLGLSMLLALQMLASCENEKELNQPTEETTFLITRNGESTDWSTEPEQQPVNAYVFSNDVFRGRKLGMTVDADNSVSLNLAKGSKVYFTMGKEEPQSLKALISGVSAEADMLAASLSGTDNSSYYLSSPAIGQSGTVDLIRTVARLDLDLPTNGLTRIERITFDNLPASTTVVGNAAPHNPTSRYQTEVNLTPAVDASVTAVKYLYESADPVRMTVYGSYNNIPITATTEVSSILRNKVYKLHVANAGASFKLTLSVREWQEGGTTESDPDVNERILINRDYSVFPNGTTADFNLNKVALPGDGASFTMAFLSDSRVDVAYLMGVTNDITVGTPAVSFEGNKVCTRIPITVAEQGRGKLPYRVKVGLKSALREQAYDYVELDVAASRHQIQTTTIAGITWMQFNARSRDLEDQIYPIDGANVEYMYENNWLSTVGGLFQWGRMHMYTPWMSGTNNEGNQNQDSPWVNTTHVPCPEGYRAPTRSELKAILPDKFTIPGSHTVNGETIDVTLHRSAIQPPAVNGVSVLARYIKLTSRESGQALYLPLSGNKGDKSTTTNPYFGHGFTYWCNEYHGGGYSYCIRFWPGGGGTSAAMATDYRQPAEAFAYLRCVKE